MMDPELMRLTYEQVCCMCAHEIGQDPGAVLFSYFLRCSPNLEIPSLGYVSFSGK